MAKQDKKIRIEYNTGEGPRTLSREAPVSEDGNLGLNDNVTEIVKKMSCVIVDNIGKYCPEGSNPTNKDWDESVEIKGTRGKLFPDGLPDSIKIGGMELPRYRETPQQTLATQPVTEEISGPSKLEQSVSAEPEIPPAERSYQKPDTREREAAAAPKISPTEEPAEPYEGEVITPQIEKLTKLIDDAYKMGCEDTKEGMAGIKKQLGEATLTIHEFEAKLQQKEGDFEWVTAAMYAYALEIMEHSAEERKDYEARLEKLEEAIKTHKTTIQEKESEISQFAIDLEEYKEKVPLLEEELSEAREYAAEQKGVADSAKQELADNVRSMGLLNQKNKELENQGNDLIEKIKNVTAEKEEAERKYLELEERYRQEKEEYGYANKAISKLSELETDVSIKKRLGKIQRELFKHREASKKIDELYSEFFKQVDALFDVKIENIRQSLIDKRNLIELFEEQRVKKEKSEEYAPKEVAQDDYNNFKNAVEYVIVSIHTACEGKKDVTLDRIDRLLSSFEIIDPPKEGVEEKDLLILKDYFLSLCGDHSNGQTADHNVLLNMSRDEFEKILNRPEFSNSHERVSMRSELRDSYDNYTPKSKR